MGDLLRKVFPDLSSHKAILWRAFNWADALIFIASCGIAVREIAAHVRDKQTDPAVICIDELELL